MLDSILSGVQPEIAILLGSAVSAALVVYAVWTAFIARDPLAGRIKALAERRAALQAGVAAPQRNRDRTRRDRGVSFMRRVVDQLQGRRRKRPVSRELKLLRAGFRSKDAPVIFQFAKVTMPFALAIAAALVLYVLKAYEMKESYKLIVVIGMFIFGFLAPDIYVSNAATKRKLAVRQGLPDALDLLVICAEAGLGMDAAFTRVSREMAQSSEAMSDELGLTAIELSFLPERRKALLNLNDRTDMPEIRAVVNTLIQTEKYGTPLAQSLRVLAAEFRNDRMMRAEEKAAKLPATLTVPMMIFILPTLFIVLLGPAALRTMDALSGLG